MKNLRKNNQRDIEAIIKDNLCISNTFKFWVMGIIFMIVIFRLYVVAYYSKWNIVSPEMLLSTVLVLIVYLWIQEMRDRSRLSMLNINLMDIKKKLEENEINIISTLVLTEEAKDPYVKGHSKKVAELCVIISQDMKLEIVKQEIIYRAGILHDLGKLGIVDAILNKTSSLNDDEWAIMKKHPVRAVEILNPLTFLFEEKEIILHHHERYDGKGYPGGLKGDKIPLGARILAVADTFDAMNSERAYRKKISKDDIISELERVSGIQLDAGIVNIFLEILKKYPSIWKREM
ncbi:MAG: HD-GYP domain-containing protein [Candidatus Omnitrophica bacterium]|nr:HD-GYP domain-containing protein [Candidatus Omnitrophota bacterium]